MILTHISVKWYVGILLCDPGFYDYLTLKKSDLCIISGLAGETIDHEFRESSPHLNFSRRVFR
jgi:hypothetical protein